MDVCVDLQHVVENQPHGLRLLHKLKDIGMLCEYVGDAMVSFMTAKSTFFKDAMLSKRHF